MLKWSHISVVFFRQVNDDLNERLKAKGINVVANVGFKSDPAEALYILKVRNSVAVFLMRSRPIFAT